MISAGGRRQIFQSFFLKGGREVGEVEQKTFGTLGQLILIFGFPEEIKIIFWAPIRFARGDRGPSSDL